MPEHPLLLDLDGTLVDSLADIAASVNHVRALRATPPLSGTAVRDHVGDGLRKLLLRTVPGLAEAEIAWAEDRYREHHWHQCLVGVRPYPRVPERLAEWHAAGRPMAVVTNKPVAFAERILGHLDLARFLGAVIGGDSVEAKKPSPLPCREALRRLGAPQGGGTMVGDGLQDLRAGKAAGLRTVAVLFGFRPEAELRAEGADEYWCVFGGDAVVEDS